MEIIEEHIYIARLGKTQESWLNSIEDVVYPQGEQSRFSLLQWK